VKIEIDPDLCEGNLRCMGVAPDLFQVNQNDKAYLLIDNPGEEFRQKAETAARVCPRQAIKVDGK
jgi:ferredoxin